MNRSTTPPLQRDDSTRSPSVDERPLPSEVIRRYRPLLEMLRDRLERRLVNAEVGERLRVYLRRGKLFRPLLVFTCAEAVGGDARQAISAAEAIELLHAASLVHDDIIDGAQTRRGGPALHVQLGTARALVAGDYLIFEALGALTAADGARESDRVLEAIGIFRRGARACCAGELAELTWDRENQSEDRYLAVARDKTGAHAAAAAALGGLFGGAGRGEIDALHAYGENVGVLFQIRDDVLDLLSEPEVLGKPVGASLEVGGPTLPLIYLLESSPAAAARLLAGERVSRGRLRRLLERERVLARIEETQDGVLRTAIDALGRVGSPRARRDLAVLARHACTRDS